MPNRYEWDPNKNRSNIRKHGVSFEKATLVFDDPHYVLVPDQTANHEERWQAIGTAGGIVVLTVVHTLREYDGDEVIRIISARRATPSERRRYVG